MLLKFILKEYIMKKLNVFNFHLTNSCNYKCKYCFGKFADSKDLTISDAKKVVDNICQYFKANNIYNGRINLAGGEPLLYKQFNLLIDYIVSKGVKVSLITNGSLLTQKMIETWKGKVSSIGLSVDSILHDTNLKIGRCSKRNSIEKEKLIDLCSEIKKRNIELKINTVVSKLNLHEDFSGIYETIKPDRVKLFQMQIVKGVNDSAKKYEITKEEFKKFCSCYSRFNQVVTEEKGTMENSYLMIDPSGNFILNNKGEYETFGDCLKEELTEIINRVPIEQEKFDSRYQVAKLKNQDKKICVFGGHESWKKGIENTFPKFRFVNYEKNYSDDLVKNSDEVWIQSNAIKHSFYKKVIAAVRRWKKPCQYFQCAGVQKCAEQIMQSVLND